MMVGGSGGAAIENKPETAISTQSGSTIKRTIAVEAVGVVDVVPDKCHLLIRVSSNKESVTHAKDSVERRVQYIKQAIQNTQIPVSLRQLVLIKKNRN